jgi:hypothetical protein
MDDLTVKLTAQNVKATTSPRLAVGKAGGVSHAGRALSPLTGRKGRPFYADTPIGKLMVERGYKAYEVAIGAGLNPRTLSYYMSREKRITPINIAKLAEFFQCSPQIFIDMNKEFDK